VLPNGVAVASAAVVGAAVGRATRAVAPPSVHAAAPTKPVRTSTVRIQRITVVAAFSRGSPRGKYTVHRPVVPLDSPAGTHAADAAGTGRPGDDLGDEQPPSVRLNQAGQGVFDPGR
jgi:hypothetical protein